MLSLEQLRKLDEENQISDQELLELRDALYPILEKILDRYFDEGAKPPAMTTCANEGIWYNATKRLDSGKHDE